MQRVIGKMSYQVVRNRGWEWRGYFTTSRSLVLDRTLWDHERGVCALRGYYDPPMRLKNKSCSSQVSSY